MPDINLLPQEYAVLRAMKRLGNATWNAITTEARQPAMTPHIFEKHKLIHVAGRVPGASAVCYALTEAGMKLIGGGK